MAKRYAAVDIGSNTVHMLVAENTPAGLNRIVNESTWLSLGEIVSLHGSIPEELVARLARTIATFRRQAEGLGAEKPYVFATEAMRVARNQKKAFEEVKRQSGLMPKIISPQREAELSLIGSRIDSAGPSPLLLVEVGGGSSQVALCHDDTVLHDASLPLGTGRLTAQLALQCPPSSAQTKELPKVIDSALERVREFPRPAHFVASGGVARGIWRALHPDGNRTIHQEELQYLVWACTMLNTREIVERFRVKQKRAGTLLPGATVLLRCMKMFRMNRVQISEYGIREGAILEIVRRGGAD